MQIKIPISEGFKHYYAAATKRQYMQRLLVDAQNKTNSL